MHKEQRFISSSMALGIVLVWLLLWGLVRSESSPTTRGAEAHTQIQQVVSELLRGQAERASGAYIPGRGVVINLALLPGAVVPPDQPAEPAVYAWARSQMQSLGPALAAVPPDETISLSVEFYAVERASWQQFVLSSRAESIDEPARYECWLNGELYTPGSSGLAWPGEHTASR